MRKISKIILHCSATRAGVQYDKDDIDRWHRAKGWDGCGYHFVIGIHGEIWLGRSITQIGAHTAGYNAESIGVCYIGGLDSLTGKPCDTRTEAQNESFKVLLRLLHRMFPEATLHGHKEFANKACPCFDVRDYAFIFNN